MTSVALLSDFGTRDPYVGIMKSVITRELGDGLGTFIDLGHDLPPQSILSAAYCLASAWSYLPEECVVLSVVDPGVGSDRRELIACCGRRTLVTPDNGTVALVDRRVSVDGYYRASPEVLAELGMRKPQYSSTFDGRDLFAPLAGRIAAAGVSAVSGKELAAEEVVRLPEPEPGARSGADAGGARVMHVDRFGNAVLSLHYSECRKPAAVALRVTARGGGSPVLLTLSDHYAAVEIGAPLLYWGSAGYLEVAVRNGSAAELFLLDIGASIPLEQSRGPR